MTSALSLLASDAPQVPIELVDATRAMIAAAKAPSTRRAYVTSWRAFTAWCVAHDLLSLPATPQTLALYITDLGRSGKRIATIERTAVAISQAHEMAGLDSPRRTALFRETLKGLRKLLGVAPVRKTAIEVELLVRALQALSKDRRGLLDRAILLVGFAGAFRRSELVALNVEDLEFTGEGATITVRRSKTDQEGAGRKLALPKGRHEATCPVEALRAWLASAGIGSGAVFRAVSRRGRVSDRRICALTVARIVKRAARTVGLDPTTVAGHSLRAGFCTSAARAGKSERCIMRQTGHRSVEMVHRYVREAGLFRDHPGDGLGL